MSGSSEKLSVAEQNRPWQKTTPEPTSLIHPAKESMPWSVCRNQWPERAAWVRQQIHLKARKKVDKLMLRHDPELGSLQGQAPLSEDATLPSNVLSSVYIVACHHSDNNAGMLAGSYCIWHFLPHRILQ